MTYFDWFAVASIVVASVLVGMAVTPFASRHGAVSYFGGDRNLRGRVIAISNTVAQIVQMESWQILFLFGATTALCRMFGGLMSVMVTEILRFVVLLDK